MKAETKTLIALFSAFLLMVLGSSYQSTLLALRTGLESFSQLTTGLLMASFFFGYAGGSVMTVGFLRSVGYVRTFAALASIASAIALLHGIMVYPPAWAVLRFIFGICYSGMVLIVESWLNAETTASRRGRILAMYGVLFMVASGAGQFGVLLAHLDSLVPFVLVSLLLSFALVPTNLMPIPEPQTPAYHRLTIHRLWEISPFGVLGVLAAGLATSGFWTLGPRFAQELGLSGEGISAFMALAILGGAAFQWPLGLLSDRLDRRLVILLAFFGLLGTSVLLGLTAKELSLHHLLLGSFLFGAFALPLYSLCLAHLNDHLSWEELVPGAGTVVLLFGVASGVGPVLAGFAMSSLGPGGLYLSGSVASTCFLIFGARRLGVRGPVAAPRKRLFQHLPRTTQVAARFLRRRHGHP